MPIDLRLGKLNMSRQTLFVKRYEKLIVKTNKNFND